jgi:hypothetical protein
MADPTLANPNVCAERGWIRLADARYEARDTQFLAGLLADEGIVLPDKIGVTGASYGGGQSMILAALRNRVMLPDGTLVPWQSPGGLDMQITASVPLIPWSDLAAALAPNGRTLDLRPENPYGDRGGVMKQSWVALLYDVGRSTGFYSAAGVDPAADLESWNARFLAGEPYDDDPFLIAIRDELTHYHSAYYLDDTVPPAPLLIYNAWTDDLFPAHEGLRYYRKVKTRHPTAEVAVHFADGFGHPRANLGGNLVRIVARLDAFFARHLKGTADAPPPAVETYTQACGGAAEQGPFTATDWDAVHPGEVRLTAEPSPATFTSAGGNAETAAAVDPVAGPPCRTVPSTDDPGAATARFAAAAGPGYTLLGSPIVVAELTASGSFAQVAARLWDVSPDGTQTLVSQGFYRPRADNLNPQTFALPPNGWHFAAGHLPKLELLGQSAPFGRPSNGFFTVTIGTLELRLPVREAPDGTVVLAPAAAVLPPEGPEPADIGPPSCPSIPSTACASAPKGTLALRDAAGEDGDRLVWKWTKGTVSADDLGDPLGTTGYALCLYGDAGMLARAAVPAGSGCGSSGETCWRARRGGFRFSDAAASSDGVRKVILKAGATGKARVKLRGDSLLTLPAIPLPQPLTVELRNGRGTCWQSVFSAPAKRNAAGKFVDRAD